MPGSRLSGGWFVHSVVIDRQITASSFYKRSAPSRQLSPLTRSFWRINFSRVEWAVTVQNGAYIKTPSCQSCPQPGAPVEDNWVWSPMGSIAMHLPERWGMLQFAVGAVNATPAVANPEWPLRAISAALYDAQHAYAAAHNGSFTEDLGALAAFVDPFYGGAAAINGTCTPPPVVRVGAGPSGAPEFVAWTVSPDGASVASITDDRYLRVFSGRDVVAAARAGGGLPADAVSPSRRGRGGGSKAAPVAAAA